MAFDIENPLVFGVHDVGEVAPGWSKGLFKSLDDAVSTFKYSEIESELEAQQKASVGELIDFHEINYGHVVQNLLTNWEKNATDALANAQSLPEKERIERGLGWLQRNCERNDRHVWPHLLGLFFWTTSSYVRAMITNEVAAVMSENVTARRRHDKGRRVHASLVAHGFGAAIAGDTLDDVYSGAWGGQRWSPEYFQFDSYHAVANARELLEGDRSDRYTGYVRPAAFGESAVFRFYDYCHRADPLTAARPGTVEWPDDLYERVSVQHVRDANVHCLEHYLQHPAVHVPILRSWFGYYCISSDEARYAQESFADVQIDGADLATRLVEEAAQLAKRELTQSPTVVEWLSAVAIFRSMVEKLGELDEDSEPDA